MKDNGQQEPRQMIRCRRGISHPIIVGVLTCLGTLALSSARATVILHDDFSAGTPFPTPNTNIWTSPWIVTSTYTNGAFSGFTRPALDGAGNVHVNHLIGNQALYALPGYLTPPAETLRLTMTMANYGGTGIAFGLDSATGAANDAGIHLRDDNLGGGSTGNWQVYMTVNNSVNSQTFNTGVPLATGGTGTWMIDWSATEVKVSFNNALIFDSAVNAPTTGGPTWLIPNTALVPMTYNYTAGDGFLSEVTFESIPEPSTLFLLGVGGLLTWQRFRRRA